MGTPLAGRLLVATPQILDPNFYRAVVLLVEHGPQGALGVVLNRPTSEHLADHVPQWAEHATAPGVVFIGGPVSNEVAVGVAENPTPRPEEFTAVLGDVGLLDLSHDPSHFAGFGHLRVYSGYSGWDGAQLENELTAGGWFLADAEPGDVFTDDPAGLWKRVIARQPGRLAFYAHFPMDPRQN